MSPPPGAPGLVRVTHHFREREHADYSSWVHHLEVGTSNPTPRRRRVSIAFDAPPQRVLVAATPHSARARAALPVLARHLSQTHDVDVLVEDALLSVAGDAARAVRKGVDGSVTDEIHLVLCLGGDGLILHVVSTLFPRAVPPIMPFNMGSLGFLTPFDFRDHARHVSAVFANDEGNNVALRMRLKCAVVRRETHEKDACFRNFTNDMFLEEDVRAAPDAELHVLNELVIDRGPAPYLSNLEVLCDDCPVTRVQADGLIVATPTGSTAYNLSAGGSMVHPGVPGILFTPICPHSLSFRPVLFPDYVTLTIKVPDDSRASAWVSFDGRHRMELMRGDKVIVTVSRWSVPTFCKSDATNDWFRSISSCLRWNERLMQGASDVAETGAGDECALETP